MVPSSKYTTDVVLPAIKCHHFDEEGVEIPIGSLRYVDPCDRLPFFLLYANGQYVKVKDYPDLYMVIGDAYCPEYIEEYEPPSMFDGILRIFGVKYKAKIIVNTEYKEGYFRLPSFTCTLNVSSNL